MKLKIGISTVIDKNGFVASNAMGFKPGFPTTFFIKIPIFEKYKTSDILLCANLRQWDAIVFGSPMLRGRVGYGVVNVP